MESTPGKTAAQGAVKEMFNIDKELVKIFPGQVAMFDGLEESEEKKEKNGSERD